MPPGWQGTLPDGVRRLDTPTTLVWLLGRTLIDGQSDLPAARQVLFGYAITPLAQWVAGARLVTAASTAVGRDSQRRHNGWSMLAGDTGRFGADYASRAVTAAVGLAANTADQAVYPNTDTDSDGRLLDGRHDYELTFAPGRLPPVKAFWSLTLYGADRHFAPNPLNRFALGDRTKGLRYGRGRSLRLFVSHRPPTGRDRANWLPAPRGRFLLYLRLYEPKPAATDGRWLPPSVVRTGH